MLPSVSDQSSVWVFQANRSLKINEIEYVKQSLAVFIPQWAAHGVNLKSDFEIVKNLFIIIGADEQFAEASGCSKDALTRQIKEIGDNIGVDFFNRLNIAYQNAKGDIELIDMTGFKTLIQRDLIRQNTIVYNNLVTTKKELLNDWEVELHKSWHANLMPII